MGKEIQKIDSGDESVNIQSGTINITNNITQINGLDEKQVREISEFSAKQILSEYFNNANSKAEKRMNEFENEFIPKFATIENALQIFNDPAFTLIYRKAQMQAACSEKTDNYKLLTELLIHRFNKRDNKNSCVGINGAIEIVDQISNDALLGLTVATAIYYGCSPLVSNISKGLEILNELYSSLINNSTLPTDNDWLDQLDILKAIRLIPYSKLNKLESIYCESMEAYTLAGIELGSDNYKTALGLLSSVNLSNILIENELIKNYVRLPLVSRNGIENLSIKTSWGSFPLNKTQKDTIYKIYDLYDKNKEINNKTKKLFIEKFDSYPALNKIHKWWNSINKSFEITIIGRVLGHSNAQRCFPGFPPLE